MDAEPRLRPDGAAYLRRHDQRHADFHPALRADGLCHGARGAGRQDVLQRPVGVPAAARVAGGGDAGDLHVLGYRKRTGRRRSRADGRHRLQPDAEGRLRCTLGSGRHHCGWHAGDSHPAFGDDHCLCGGGRPIGGEALCLGHVPGLLPGVPVSRLHHRLGIDQSQDCTALAGERSACAHPRMDQGDTESLFAQHADQPHERPRNTRQGIADADGADPRHLSFSGQESFCGLVSAGPHRCHLLGYLVVCGDPSAGRRPACGIDGHGGTAGGCAECRYGGTQRRISAGTRR